jgi:hypothetical protein
MTITLTREEAQQVLDALEAALSDDQPYIVSCKHTVETLRAKLSEPEAVAKMQEMLEVQGSDGNWNYDPYMHGMYNGMEYMLSMVESREPVFREAPKKWLSKREPEPEPVAWMFQHEETGLTDCIDAQQVEWGFEKNNPRWQKIAPLYTAPPQRDEASAKAAEWVGLTDDEVDDIGCDFATLGGDIEGKNWFAFYLAIEAKLKEKNG